MKIVLSNDEIKEVVKEHVRHILGEVIGDKELSVSGIGYGDVDIQVVEPEVDEEK